MSSSARETSWLPPDNVQETPQRQSVLRTSPTNIGLWMLATVETNDFGYITSDDLVARNLGTLETLGRLERFEGHLFNSYRPNESRAVASTLCLDRGQRQPARQPLDFRE